jgi:hypothetical protein
MKMNIFNKLFGKDKMSDHTNGNGSGFSSTAVEDNNVNVLEDLFVDPNPPVAETVQQSPTGLQLYLEQDFFRKGYEDGYRWHSAEMLENKLKSLKADFRYNASLKIEQVRLVMLQVEKHSIGIEGMSPRMEKQINAQIASLQVIIDNLENEKALSAEDEGLAMIGVHQYRDGFIRGTEAYQQEKLLASSTGLFN